MKSPTLWAYVDLLASFLAVVLIAVALSMPKRTAANDEALSPPGNVIVEALWADSLDADVDLWVRAPGDVPVGYSNKSGRIFNLLRDDLGQVQDITDLNHEVAYSRGMPAGEYCVNLHMYRAISVTFPLPVKIVVSRKAGDSTRQIIATTATLEKEGQEITAMCFRLDEKGSLVLGSMHDNFTPLRSATK